MWVDYLLLRRNVPFQSWTYLPHENIQTGEKKKKMNLKMQAYFFPIIKSLLHLSLVVIFWIIFGSVSVRRFERQNVLVSSSTIGPDPEGLQVPAITICGRNTSSSMGWKGTKNPNITTLKEVLRHMCGEHQNVTKCIEEKTFGQGCT